ncbi:MAG: hypothetical protein J6E40_05610 [Lachnospiraceae bacterium]|nr:hypothetical protein [Lachnospiraceae bacterium]
MIASPRSVTISNTIYRSYCPHNNSFHLLHRKVESKIFISEGIQPYLPDTTKEKIRETAIKKKEQGAFMHPADWIFAERRHLFTQQDINSIDTDYFKIESKGSGCIVIQSKNTGHFWAISGA